MKRIMFIISIIVFTSASAFAVTGREIMGKNDSLKKYKTSRNKSVLLIIKDGRSEKKEYEGVGKRYGRELRLNMSFTYPTRLGFLVWDKPGRDKLQWLKLSSGKVRKVAASDKDKPWMNSHFYNEDIGERHIEDYEYKLLGEGNVMGVDCYRIKGVKTRGTRVYSKTVLYVGKNDWVIRKVEFYLRGMHVKTLRNERIEKINGIFTFRKIVMERTDGKGKSILYLRSVDYNRSISGNKFKRESF